MPASDPTAPDEAQPTSCTTTISPQAARQALESFCHEIDVALLALQHAADELREQGHPLGPIVYVATDKIVDVVERINNDLLDFPEATVQMRVALHELSSSASYRSTLAAALDALDGRPESQEGQS